MEDQNLGSSHETDATVEAETRRPITLRRNLANGPLSDDGDLERTAPSKS